MIRRLLCLALFLGASSVAFTRLDQPLKFSVPIAVAGVCIALNAWLENEERY